MINHRFSPLSKQRNKSGFTLLEVLVSGAVLSVVLVGLVMLLSYNIKSDDQARNRVVASELTQAGTDFFLQARNILGFRSLEATLSSSQYCLGSSIENFSSMQSDPNAFFSNLEGTDCSAHSIEVENTSFVRQAQVDLTEEDQIDITVTVTWLSNNRQVSTSSRLRLKPR